MSRRCASSIASWAMLAALSLLLGCSSTPKKDSGSQAAQSSKATGVKGDKNAVVEPEIPAGPPPIPPEATQAFERAVTLLSAGDLDAAIKEFQHLSEKYPDYAGPQINLGIAYSKGGKLDEAEKALKAATQRGEPNAAAFNQLGIVYRKLGRFKDADAAYSEAVRIDPGYALAHLNLGVLCDMYLQQPQRALTELERYMQLTPSPDARVATWVKELQGRVGGNKSPAIQPPVPATTAAPVTNTASGQESASK